MNVRYPRKGDRTRLTGPLRSFSSQLQSVAPGVGLPWPQFGPILRVSGRPDAQIERDRVQLPLREEIGPEVRVPLGHDHGVVPHDLLQLLDGAAAEDPR